MLWCISLIYIFWCIYIIYFFFLAYLWTFLTSFHTCFDLFWYVLIKRNISSQDGTWFCYSSSWIACTWKHCLYHIHAHSSAVTTRVTIFAWCWFLLTVLALLVWPVLGLVVSDLCLSWRKKQLLAVKLFIHSKHRKMLLCRPTSERQRSLTTAGSVCKVNWLILEEISSSEIVSMRRS